MSYQVSISPQKIALYWQSERAVSSSSFRAPRMQVARNDQHKISLSKKAAKRMRNAVNWLTYLSAPRKIVTNSRKVIPDFQVSFITLTLPTKQMHSHAEIKSKCLNHFLTVARQKWKVSNYVWKIELQSNGNAHFHLTFDRYVHHMAIRREWNQVIAKLGYIKAYHDTFSGMKFDEYLYWRRQTSTQDVRTIKRAYAYGVSTNWRSPNTTDVKKVSNVRNLSAYLAKYISKPIVSEERTGLIADSVVELKGRLWFCSQSLSALGNAIYDYSAEMVSLMATLRANRKHFRFESDYVEVIFFRHTALPPWLSELLRQLLVSFAVEAGYPFPHSALKAGYLHTA